MKDGLMIYNVTKEDAKRNYVCHAMDIDSPMPDAKLMNIAVHVTSKFHKKKEKIYIIFWAGLYF